MSPVLEIKGLSIDYGVGEQAVRAVNTVDLTLHRGEVLGLAGESGSGKSTLAYGATRLLPPPGVVTAGSVLYHPEHGEPVDLLRMTRQRAARVPLERAVDRLPGRDELAEPGGHRRRAAHRRHRGAPAEVHQGRAHDARRRAAVPGRHRPGPAGQLPAPALRRHAAARDDRDGAGPGAAGGHHGRADHRAGRGDAAADHAAAVAAARSSWASPSSSSPTTCRCWWSSATGSRSCTAAGSSRRRRPSELYDKSLHPYSDGLLHSFPALRGPRRELSGIPGSPPDLRAMPRRLRVPAALPEGLRTLRRVAPAAGPADLGSGAVRGLLLAPFCVSCLRQLIDDQ